MSFLRSDRTPEHEEPAAGGPENADHPWSGPWGDDPGPGEPGPISQEHPWCGPGGDDPPPLPVPPYDGPTIEQDNRTPEERQLSHERTEWNEQVREWLHEPMHREPPEEAHDTPGPPEQTSGQPYDRPFPEEFDFTDFAAD